MPLEAEKRLALGGFDGLLFGQPIEVAHQDVLHTLIAAKAVAHAATAGGLQPVFAVAFP
ncbi:MAG: hypothetical protein ABSG17_03235 [Spirochaetia bacterium]